MRISDLSSDLCSSDLLAAAWLPLPGDTAENRQPVVRRADVGFGVGPHIPVGLRIVAATAAFLEPRMLDRVVTKDRKSVVSGKSVYVRVDLGGRRCIKQQTQRTI